LLSAVDILQKTGENGQKKRGGRGATEKDSVVGSMGDIGKKVLTNRIMDDEGPAQRK